MRIERALLGVFVYHGGGVGIADVNTSDVEQTRCGDRRPGFDIFLPT